MLASITPVILTFNEAPNIERTLAKLAWASDIVVVDSNSSDGTPDLVRTHSKARLIQRAFDTHARQWNFAIGETGIRTPWILALDADYVLTDALVEELTGLQPPLHVAGYSADFEYCIDGNPLRGSVYPPVVVLFRKGSAAYRQDGHTQRLEVRGDIARLANRIRHDDRKPMSRWLAAQNAYMALEARKLTTTPSRELPLADRIRKTIVLAPVLVFFYALFVRGTILDGRAGLFYAFQRSIAESILSLHLVRRLIGAARGR